MLRLCSCRTQQRWENQEAVKMGNFLLYLTTRRSSLKEKFSGAFHTKCSNVYMRCLTWASHGATCHTQHSIQNGQSHFWQQFQKSKFKTKQSQAVFRYAVKQFDKGDPDKSANLKWLVNFGFLCQLPDILNRPSVQYTACLIQQSHIFIKKCVVGQYTLPLGMGLGGGVNPWWSLWFQP